MAATRILSRFIAPLEVTPVRVVGAMLVSNVRQRYRAAWGAIA